MVPAPVYALTWSNIAVVSIGNPGSPIVISDSTGCHLSLPLPPDSQQPHRRVAAGKCRIQHDGFLEKRLGLLQAVGVQEQVAEIKLGTGFSQRLQLHFLFDVELSV